MPFRHLICVLKSVSIPRRKALKLGLLERPARRERKRFAAGRGAGKCG